MIRVLVADGSDRIKDNLRRRIESEPGFTVTAVASGGDEAIQESLRARPDVAVIDAALPGLDGLQVTEMLAQFAPATGIILMALESENDLMRRAMFAGAREVLQKPFSGAELIAAVERVHEFQERRRRSGVAATARAGSADGQLPADDSPSPRGRLVTVVSGKGGVGKTVLATNLAVALKARSHGGVAILDLALQFGDVAALLDVTSQRTIADLAAHDAVADTEVVQEVLASTPSGVRVMPAPPSPELADYVTTQHLRALLDALRGEHELVVADTTSQLSEVTLEAVESSDRIVLLTDYSVTAVKNTRLVMSVLGVLKIPNDRVLLLANHRDAPSENALTRAQAENFLGARIALEVPFDPAVVGATVSRGTPFVTTAPQSGVAKAIGTLADLIVTGADIASPAEPAEPPPAAKRQRRRLSFARL